MNKQELITAIAEKGNLTKKDSEAILNLIGEVIEELLANGEEFKIPSVGKFFVTDTKARVGRNPQTGEEIEIPASKAVKFRPCSSLKEAVK